MKTFSEIWNSYSVKWKIFIILTALMFLCLSTRSIIFTILAWIIIIGILIKIFMDFEFFWKFYSSPALRFATGRCTRARPCKFLSFLCRFLTEYRWYRERTTRIHRLRSLHSLHPNLFFEVGILWVASKLRKLP